MISCSNRVSGLQLSQIRTVLEKARALEQQGKNIIHLEIGEPDFPTPDNIINVTKRALDEGQTHYGPNRGLLPLRQAISVKLAGENDIKMDPEREIIVTVGGAEALAMTYLAFLDPEDEVIIVEPAFVNYQQLGLLCGAKPVVVQAREENSWLVDIDDLEKAISAKTKLLVINTPNNPTGAVYPGKLLEAIARLAVEHDLLVLSDEIYEKIIYRGCKHVSIASLPGMRERTITLNGYSKAYAMTGWRLAYVAASENLIIPLLKAHQYLTTCAPTFGQVGAEEATEGSQECVKQMVGEFEKRRDLVCTGLAAIDKLSFIMPQGAFYIFVNISRCGMKAHEFAEVALNNAGVAVVPGTAFMSGGEKYVRLSYASSYESLVEAMNRLKKILA